MDVMVASHWGTVQTLAQRKLECSAWSFGVRTLGPCLNAPEAEIPPQRIPRQQECGRKSVLGMDRVPSPLLSTPLQNLEWKNPIPS